MALDAWTSELKRMTDLFNSLSDEDLIREVAPGRNRGMYLLGHMASVHDGLMVLLRFEPAMMFPELQPIFHHTPDRAVADADLPSIATLREQYKTVNDRLMQHFSATTPDEWFSRHNNLSEEDFAKEPHRNRLNVVLSRTSHMAYHRGQVVFLTKKV